MTTNAHFHIGHDVGPVGRWFRLFVGAYFLVFLVLNPLLVNPMARADLLPFAADVGLSLAAIIAIYLVVFRAIGELVLSKMNPWTGTIVFLGTPTVLLLAGVLPAPTQVALGMYISASLIVTFFMRYGGCEVVALPSVLFRRRYTMYCPYNSIDAVERAVSLDVSTRRGRIATIVSLGIVVFVGGYFFLVETEHLLGIYGVAVDLDNRWAFLLLVPIANLLSGAWTSFLSDTERRGDVRNYLLGAGVLILALIVFLQDGLSDNAVWRWVMVLGGLIVVWELISRAAAALGARRAGSLPAVEVGAGE
ncbi:MAG: DUF6410 domain-containing protein [Gemmatimonadota bacterium]